MRNLGSNVFAISTTLAACLIGCASPPHPAHDAAPGAGDAGAAGDGPPPADASIDPAGEHHRLVVDRVLVSGGLHALDLDGDGRRDDGLGAGVQRVRDLVHVLAGDALPAEQDVIDAVVRRGQAIALLDLQATDLASATGAGLTEYVGADPSPAPCLDPADLSTCGRHLDGTGAFTIAAGSPLDERVGGTITPLGFVGGPGTAMLPLTVLDSAPFWVHLVDAHAQVEPIDVDHLHGAILGGAITKDEVDGVMIPALIVAAQRDIARDCAANSGGVHCDCPASTAGLAWMTLLDRAPLDCQVTTDEARGVLAMSFALDVTYEGHACLSVGVGIDAVPARYASP